MKLVIQIPCYNERDTLPGTLAELPRAVPGFHTVEVLVVDDGSTDGTSEVARACGVHHIVRFAENRGLARGFMAGLDAALRLGADVIVNTDADNQYRGPQVLDLVRPIVEGRADIVVGDRQVGRVAHFSFTKRQLQRVGSWVVRLASATDVPDTTSGFRAISRNAAMRVVVTSDFSYTLETLIQAGRSHQLAITSVPIEVNRPTRESRLFRSIVSYVRSSGTTILRVFTLYSPVKTFLAVAGVLVGSGLLIGLRFLWAWFQGTGQGMIQSLILASILLVVGAMTALVGMVADLVRANRVMLEELIMRVRRLEYGDAQAGRGPFTHGVPQVEAPLEAEPAERVRR